MLVWLDSLIFQVMHKNIKFFRMVKVLCTLCNVSHSPLIYYMVFDYHQTEHSRAMCCYSPLLHRRRHFLDSTDLVFNVFFLNLRHLLFMIIAYFDKYHGSHRNETIFK